jgi:DNA-binding NtrC family response regulator
MKTKNKEYKEAMRKAEKTFIMEALRKNDWNKTLTAQELGIDRKTLYNKMAQLKIALENPENRSK